MTHLWRFIQILLVFPFLAAMVLALWEAWVKDSRIEYVALGVAVFLVLGIRAIQRRIRQLKNPQPPEPEIPEVPVEQEVTVTRYIIRFGIVYTLGLIALSVVFTIFDLDHNTGASTGLLGEEQGLAEIVPRADQLSIPLIAGVFGFVSLMYLAVLEYSFGGLAKKHYAGLKKKGKL
ncbi:MAG TPA: hypothetical protein ENJ80_04945 [Gammaproteobacteria bacterium]|nr:hypothetical protein [Gammaproteobacteria bacterium]